MRLRDGLKHRIQTQTNRFADDAECQTLKMHCLPLSASALFNRQVGRFDTCLVRCCDHFCCLDYSQKQDFPLACCVTDCRPFDRLLLSFVRRARSRCFWSLRLGAYRWVLKNRCCSDARMDIGDRKRAGTKPITICGAWLLTGSRFGEKQSARVFIIFVVCDKSPAL